MTASEVEKIKVWGEGLTSDPSLRFVRTADERSAQFDLFCETLQREAPRVKLWTEHRDTTDPPELSIQDRWRYHAVPGGGELEPFLETVAMAARGRPPLEEALRERVAAVPVPADIVLYVATQCPHCPLVMRALAPLPLVNPLLRLTVIDGLLFPELARVDGVQSVPTTLVAPGFRWTGELRVDDLVDVLSTPDPSRLDSQVLERMLREGQADTLARLVVEGGEVFPALIELLVSPEWSLRLGAMTVLEEVAEHAPTLASDMLETLWEKFDAVDAPIQGDIVYQAGMFGGAPWADRLRRLLAGPCEDELREAAEEALEALEDRL